MCSVPKHDVELCVVVCARVCARYLSPVHQNECYIVTDGIVGAGVN